MVQKINNDLYRITVSLPGNPLRSLNSYVITGGERNLLIDTGFNRPECLYDLEQGIEQLNLDMNRTDIFVTHLHADHSGLVSKIAKPLTRIFMGKSDKALLDKSILDPDNYWNPMKERFREEGYPEEELNKSISDSPARIFVPDKYFEASLVEDGSILPFGNDTYRCIFTPGHTPGHFCLYDTENEFLYTGDHLLFDISPNITVWSGVDDSLSQYMGSLKKIRDIPVKLALTGHRENEGDYQIRIEQLLLHHAERLEDTMQIIRENDGLNGYQIAGYMKWSIRAAGWDDFPVA